MQGWDKTLQELKLGDTSTAYLQDVARAIQNPSDSIKELVLKWKQALAGLEDQDSMSSHELQPVIQAMQRVNAEHNKTNKSRQRAINVLLQLPTMDLPAVQSAFEEAYFNRDLDTIRIMAVYEDINPHCNVEKLKSALSEKPEYHALRAYSNNPDYLASVGAVREHTAYQKIKDASGIDVKAHSVENIQLLRERVGLLNLKESQFKDIITQAFDEGNFHLTFITTHRYDHISRKDRYQAVLTQDDKKALKVTDTAYSRNTRKAQAGDITGGATFEDDVKFGNSDFVFTRVQLGPPQDYPDNTQQVFVEPGKLPRGSFFNERDPKQR
jgi:hypothetical protein